jgi:DNA primase
LGDDVKRVLDAATEHFHTALWRAPAVLDALHGRGLADGTLRRLRIGYARGDLGQALFGQGYDLRLAARAGLISPRGEFMRGRIVIPVLDTQGSTVWMIGRAVKTGDAPKYLGLPEGLVHKQPMIVGTAQRGTIWVEGAFDLAALVQWGLDEAYLLIALLGTAFEATVQQLLPQLTPQTIVCTDQDFAGKQAGLKLAMLLRAHGVEATVLVDADRRTAMAAWVARAQQKPVLSDQERAKLTQGQNELAAVEALASQHLLRWVKWSNAAKDPGDLCKMGERGQSLFFDALLA